MSKGNILIVDDLPENLKVLAAMLTRRGYEVRPAISGQVALRAIESVPPDIILLDISMPDMDGYEVCQRLKANPETEDIPVIFISAKDETEDKVKAFEMGGVDYVTKPFQVEEVLARVRAHLRIGELQRDLQEQVAELEAYAHTVAHDLKNPLALIISSLHLVEDMGAQQSIDDELKSVIGDVSNYGYRAMNIVDELLLLATVRKQDTPSLEPINMAVITANVMLRLSLEIERSQANIIEPDEWPKAMGYAPWIEEIWVNYISNAIKYGGKPPVVELGVDVQDGQYYFWVKDNGKGMTEEEQASLFTEFSRLAHHQRVDGHGLGLSIVERIASKLGGEAGVQSKVGEGSLFYFSVPVE